MNHPMLIVIKTTASTLAQCSVLELDQMFKRSGLPPGVLKIVPFIIYWQYNKQTSITY